LERYEPDAIRYALAANLPETSDVDLTEEEMVRRINEELVATWGNLVNRVLSMTHRYFDGVVATPGPQGPEDGAVLDAVDDALAVAGEHLGGVRLRQGLAAVFAGAQAVNQYLSEMEPWKTAKEDPGRTGTTLYVAVQALSGLAAGLAPYLPATSGRVLDALGVTVAGRQPAWRRYDVPAGTRVANPGPLFAKVELAPDGA
jgi:methionyl-tRNA synthetase